MRAIIIFYIDSPDFFFLSNLYFYYRNVQVTLDILNALVEKCPEDLNLFAQNIVNVLTDVVSGNDFLLVKHTNHVFDTFCKSHDLALFRGDPSYVVSFQNLVSLYVNLANGNNINPRPNETEWKVVGIEASKSITTSVALSTVVGATFIPEIIPILLTNLSTASQEKGLVDLNSKIVILDSRQRPNRRQSIQLDTAVPLDLSTDEQLLYKSLQTLRHIVETTSTSVSKTATRAVLKYILDNSSSLDWASELLEVMTTWVPVQTRFVVLMELIDQLVILPITDIPNQKVVVRLVTSLLSSTVSMIGLSVIDILRTLLQHEYHLLQSDKQTSALDQLIEALKECIISLSLHIYYASQLSDMIAETLMKCKYPGKSVVAPGVNTVDNSVTVAFLVHNLEIIYKMILLAPKSTGNVDHSQLSVTSWNGSQDLLNYNNSDVKEQYTKALLLFFDCNVIAWDYSLRLSNDFKIVDGSFFGRLLVELYTLVTNEDSSSTEYNITNRLMDSFVSNLGEHGLVRAVAFALAIEDKAKGLLFENVTKVSLEGRDLIAGLALTSISLMIIKKVAFKLGMNDLAYFVTTEMDKRQESGVWYDLSKSNLSFNTENLSKLSPVVVTDIEQSNKFNSLYSIINAAVVKQQSRQQQISQECVDPLAISNIILEADFTGRVLITGDEILPPSIMYSLFHQQNGNGFNTAVDSKPVTGSNSVRITRAKSLNQLRQHYQAGGGSIRGVPVLNGGESFGGADSTNVSIQSGINNETSNGVAEESTSNNEFSTSKESQPHQPTVRDLKRVVSGLSIRSAYMHGYNDTDNKVNFVSEIPSRRLGVDVVKKKIDVSSFLDTLDVNDFSSKGRFV